MPLISPAQNSGNNTPEILKVEAKLASGFAYPYYLYVPMVMRQTGNAKGKHTLLVIPNNPGKASDDSTVHEADVERKIKNTVKTLSGFNQAIE